MPRPVTHLGRIVAAMAAISAVVLLAGACGEESSDNLAGDAESGESIVMYSGRSEDVIGPLVEQFEDRSGIDVEPRYGDSAELATSIRADAGGAPADVFISQSSGALGLLDDGLLAPLPGNLLAAVGDGVRGTDGTWVGLAGRVRVLVYDEALVAEDELPQSVLDLTGPAYGGRVAVAPTDGSFQDFVTAMRYELGEDRALAWLEGMSANESPNYASNAAIVEAVGRGEVDMGLVDHDVNLRALEADPSAPSRNHFFPADDIGALAIVTGGAVLESSAVPEAGAELLEFLLGADAQTYFVDQDREYALAVRVPVRVPEGAPEFDGSSVDIVDFDVLADGLTGTLELIDLSGIER